MGRARESLTRSFSGDRINEFGRYLDRSHPEGPGSEWAVESAAYKSDTDVTTVVFVMR